MRRICCKNKRVAGVIAMKSIIQSITIWGDSILKGVLFNPEKSKYTILKDNCARLVTEKLGLKLDNRSSMGRTIIDGHTTLNRDLTNRNISDIAIIEFGGNDCDFHWDEISDSPHAAHMPKTPLHIFEAQLKTILQSVKEKDMLPVLMTLPPLHAQRYFEFISKGLNKDNILAWLGGDVQMIYRWHERYSNAIMRIASEFHIHIVDIRDSFLSDWNYGDLLCADGIHPNQKGHSVMAETFIAYAKSFTLLFD